MRQITSHKEIEKKRSKTQMFLAIFILGILGLSTAGYAVFYSSGSNTLSQKYKGISFRQTDNGWQGEGFEFYTSFLPQDVESIPFSGVPRLEDFSTRVYFVTASSDIPAREWANSVPMQSFQLACLPEEANLTGCEELPLKDCSSASSDSAVIIFKESNVTSASYSPFCFTVSGDEAGAVKAVDKALFLMSGIIENA